MKISKSTIVLLVFVLMLSIFVANVADLISVDSRLPDETLRDNNGEIRWSRPKYYDIGKSYDHLIWFLQISDIHISIFKDPSRISELKEFCNVTIDSIKPTVVLASGDLTDAKSIDEMGSKQILEEWQYYKYIIDETNIKERTLWLDVRGNHDNFNVVSLDSKNNYYSNYSIQGKKYPRSYMYNVNVGSETYSFIAIDACLKPGPRRPFNFIGILDQQEIDKIQQLVNQSKESNADHAIVFGHYPTSCILSQSDTNIRNILGRYRKSMVYLCGHYHMLGGMVPNMYTLQKAGFLELELADWKDNRIILAFSTVSLKIVEIQLDDNAWQKCDHIKGPLYVLPWNSTKYREGIHQITVRVIDKEGREKVVSHLFSLDGSWLSSRILPKLVLMFNVVYIFRFLFAVTLAISIVPLCLLRFLHMYYKNRHMHRPRLRIKFFHWWLRKLWILSTIDKAFYGLMLYSLYLTIGPWTVGEIIEDHIGVIFIWGIFIGNRYLPGGFTYAYGYFQLCCFYLPLMLIMAHRVDRRLQEAENPARQTMSKFRLIWHYGPTWILILIQSIMAYILYLEYGIIAILLCPLRTGSIIIAALLCYYVNTMPLSCLRSAASVWSPHGAINNNNAI
ncbi:transmembrane protein 62-like isoform X2 [Cataglyphis hispanica]|uniref:transmembrane protein 62-like isoform X2 n=1 Tax=Cataglyphis hispanica TaxID=1086592 RepID=UPI00217FA53A|nr:transmembrane protein 62-like isoform X2 [Cataglyphis hispanica]